MPGGSRPRAGDVLRVLPLGSDDVLVELGSLEDALALRAALAADPPRWLAELVPAARTVRLRVARNAPRGADLLSFLTTASGTFARGRSLPVAAHSHPQEPSSARRIGPRETAGAGRAAARTGRGEAPVVVPVRYDGADLAEVAALTGLTPEEVVRRHAAAEYTVAFTGFAPGFGYLVGGDPALAVPRWSSPRTRVPAGAVGLAGEFTGVYPRASPGGWMLVGTALVDVWDADRQPPALLEPGRRVRFVDADADADADPDADADAGADSESESDGDAELMAEAVTGWSAAAPVEPPAAAIEVVAAGLQLLVEDLGRPGHAALGVAGSGAADRDALREANRLVGNDDGAAALEAAGGGAVLRAERELLVAVTGAEGSVLVVGAGRELAAPRGRAFLVFPGERLELGPPARGIRSVIAVRGGLDVPRMLGSAASDTLTGLGPRSLVAGDVLAVRHARHGTVGAPGPLPRPPSPDRETVLEVVLGPRDDWFGGDALTAFAEASWLVTPRSDRVGARLDGPSLARRSEREGAELPSEPLVAGALQVPPDGHPILFGRDHPVTGGYPVIAVVAAHELDRAMQLPPGARVRFRPIAR